MIYHAHIEDIARLRQEEIFRQSEKERLVRSVEATSTVSGERSIPAIGKWKSAFGTWMIVVGGRLQTPAPVGS
jgi:hypothetical protein